MDNEDLIKREPDRRKIQKEYLEWVDKITPVPSKAIYFLMFTTGLVWAILDKKHNEAWYVQPLLIIALTCLFVLVRREGHKEGYVDGFESGYGQGKDDALGIDDDMHEFIDEVKRDNHIEKITKNISENKSQ